MKLSSIKIDAVRADQGIWIKDIPGLDDVAVLVRSSDNADARALRSKLVAALPLGAAGDPKQIDRIAVRVMAETTLRDWSGIEDDAGNAVPFSVEKATELLSDPDYRALLGGVLWASAQVERQSRVEVDVAAKN